jgi:hypothetical protein
MSNLLSIGDKATLAQSEAVASKSSAFAGTTQKRWPVGASMTHQVRTGQFAFVHGLLQIREFHEE